MKTPTLLALFILACLTACGQSHHIIVKTLDVAYLEGCETGKGACDPIEIIRQTKQDSVLLVFPNGGTESDVFLHTVKNKKWELHDKKRHGQGQPTLNLTRLDDGEYTANMISCGLGGSCTIRLTTKVK